MIRRLPIPVLPLAVSLLAAASSPAAFSQGPGLAGFEPVGYVMELGGRTLTDAEIFHSRGAGAFLVLDPGLPAPVLVRLREARVETVNLMKVERRGDGTIDLLPGATLADLGGFRLTTDGGGISFQVDGRQAVVKEKPPLLGKHDLASMRSNNPEYVRTADAYSPSPPMVSRLKQETRPVRVEVYFGTWCPFCTQMLPRLMKVAEQIEGSSIEVEFHGLPRSISSDPAAANLKITGVPTAVVFVAGREVGRIQGNGWKVPELALTNLLSQT